MWKGKPRFRETRHLPKVFKANVQLNKNATPGLSNNKAPTFKHYTHTDHLVHGRNRSHQVCNSWTILETPHFLEAPGTRLCASHLSLTTLQGLGKLSHLDQDNSMESRATRVWSLALESAWAWAQTPFLSLHTVLTCSGLPADGRGILFLLLPRGPPQALASSPSPQNIPCSPLGNCKLQSHLFTGSFHQVHTSLNLEHPFHPPLIFLRLTTSASSPLYQNP